MSGTTEFEVHMSHSPTTGTGIYGPPMVVYVQGPDRLQSGQGFRGRRSDREHQGTKFSGSKVRTRSSGSQVWTGSSEVSTWSGVLTFERSRRGNMGLGSYQRFRGSGSCREYLDRKSGRGLIIIGVVVVVYVRVSISSTEVRGPVRVTEVHVSIKDTRILGLVS